MAKTTIKELKKGDFFRLKEFREDEVVNSSSVWIRGDYERSSKKYSCSKFDDFCHENFFRGDKVVYVDFEF